ncbi:PAS domain S-box protein [Candidatus Venteria ishoeyi]|nr:DUF3365 domain-containing protein [Candidatus Venteria ishoeyi]MDM8545067.1 PAS domain S-box protein [Candidatus Venteria ishoeyi]
MALTLVSAIVLIAIADYFRIQRDITNEHLKDARDIRAMLMATRRIYHHQFLDSGLPLNDKTLGFLPAHALTRISIDFPNWSESGMSFNNVSDRPRNLTQSADELELEAMDWFRANPDAHERLISFRNKQGRFSYHYSTPIYVERYCLKCHGNEQDAPSTIAKHYNTAFNYKEGDLRGLLSIKLPSEEISTILWRELVTEAVIYLFPLLIALGLLFLLLERNILRHLRNLNNASAKIANGDFSIRLPTTVEDELGHTIIAFNIMVNALGEREREQQFLHEKAEYARRQMEAVLNNTTSLIYIKDLEGRYKFINRQFEILFHISNEEIHDKTVAELFPPEQAEFMHSNDIKVIAEDKAVEVEEVIRQDDGIHTYLSIKFPLKSTTGETYAICGISTDITVRIQMERTASKQAAIWQSLMSSTTEAIFGLASDGICTFCNPAALQMLGYKNTTELVGKKLHPLVHAHHANGKEYPHTICRMQHAIKTGQVLKVEDEVLWRADGNCIPVIYRVTPIYDADKVTGAVITCEDITEHLATQRENEQRMEELEQFNRLAVGRELKMIELKKEINALLHEQGKDPRYHLH